MATVENKRLFSNGYCSIYSRKKTHPIIMRHLLTTLQLSWARLSKKTRNSLSDHNGKARIRILHRLALIAYHSSCYRRQFKSEWLELLINSQTRMHRKQHIIMIKK